MNPRHRVYLITLLVIVTGTTGLVTSRLTADTLPQSPELPARQQFINTPALPGLLTDDPSAPEAPVKLIFIHHSCGQNWLNDGDGGLGIALRDNNYFVSDTNYGWGPPDADLGYENIGDHTDIGHWYNWFVGPNAITYTNALYTEYGQHSTYSRLASDPGGENEIIMFKSCYPNSHLGGNPTDPPTVGDNPLRGHDAYDDAVHTVANAKGIYNDLLTYFATRQEKLFVVVTAPPLQSGDTDASHAASARALNDWLVDEENGWLDGYPYDNVAVWDFYNVLTSNGGDPNTNDLGQETGNHHRWWDGAVQHTHPVDSDTSAYPGGSGGGSHPTAAGNQKATAEFVPLLNVFYNRWQAGAPPAPTLTLTAPNGGESWTVGSQHEIAWTTSGSIANVSLAYSTDGFSASHIIEPSTPNDGSYTWTVPDDASATVRVRVASVVSPTTVYDDSDADFAIISGTGAESYRFNAVITPANATQPVTYVWSPEPASGQGTASATYQWSPGTYEVTLAVTNCGGTFTATRNVTVGSTRAARRNEVAAHQGITQQGVATTVTFQDGVHPNASYNGTRDVILANDTENVYANANLGGTENLETFFGDGVEHRRSLISWELAALPTDVTVDAATVELYRYHDGASNDIELALYRITREWTEGTGWEMQPPPSYVPDGATWLTATTGVAWTTPGGDYDATLLDQITLPTGMGDGWVRLDATAAVQAWVSGSAPNYGLLLRPLSGDYTYHYFHSREGITPTLRPRLVATYTSGAPAPTLEITAPAGGTRWPVSSTQQIRWTTSGTVAQVNVSYSLGDGFRRIASDVANTGTYDWTIPPTATLSARVRVESVVSPTTVYDVSDVFTLAETDTATYTLHLPLALRDYVPPQPCLDPLTGVAIDGPFASTASELVQPSDLVYQGAFVYPAGDEWAYSGHALAYYPAGDAESDDSHPGSLYVAGHTNQDLVGEISIPQPVISGNFEDLPQASVLQPLVDITAGWKDHCTYTEGCLYREVDGLEYLPNVAKIVWNLKDWYNVTGYDQDSLGWSDRDMTGAQGVWHIGDRPSDNNLFHNAKTCNYLFQAPTSFANENLEGKWLIAGNHREAGALGGSQGPTLYALAPWEDGTPPASGQALETLALLYYSEVYECVWEAEGNINEHPAPGVCHFPDYRAMDYWGGGAWVQTGSVRGILIFGRKGLGDNCYGSMETCGADPCAPSSGYHAYPYEPQILFYDPEALKEVLAGTREPWEVLPYAVHSPTGEMLGGECARLGSAALDRESGFVYVAEQEAGPSGETVIHVWRVQ